MPVTATNSDPGSAGLQTLGHLDVGFFTLAFDNSYPTGGEAVAPSLFGLDSIAFISISASAGYVFEYDHTNKKVLVYYGDNNNAADGPLVEVPNATNLSALNNVRCMVVGRS